MTSAISIHGLKKSYNGTEALKGIDLEVKPGEFFGFLGPNGAGKTTTIGILSGLVKYPYGSVKIFGKDVVKNYKEARSLLGLVPQEVNFDHFFSIEDILLYQAMYYEIPRANAKQRAKELLNQFDLWSKRKSTIRQLSGGMKRRLLIARALVHNPKLLILDEPTAGVDVELRRELWQYLQQLNKQGITVFLTTHYIEEAESLANRIGIIHKGVLVAVERKEVLMKKMSDDEIRITVKKGTKHIPEKLGAYPVEFDAKRSQLIIRCSRADEKLHHFIQALQKHNIQIERTELKKSKLEDIFLQLTQ